MLGITILVFLLMFICLISMITIGLSIKIKKNMIGVPIKYPNSQVRIMRGIPGAGKSTEAERIAKELGGVIVSSDAELIEIGGGDYQKGFNTIFDDGRPALSVSHRRCFYKFKAFLSTEKCVIVDNTNILRGHIKQYVREALEQGYDENNIQIVDIGLNGFTVDELVLRNTHNVPKEDIERMIASYNASGAIDVKTIFMYDEPIPNPTNKKIDDEKLIDTLTRYYNDGWLIRQRHPTKDLYVWNYSVKTTYEGKWDKITLMCRSLVTDFNGVIISRGFGKFFNYEEIRYKYPIEEFIGSKFYEKVDGSYIGIFNYGGEWIARSKGSFDTIQSKTATELFNLLSVEDKAKFSKKLTHNFEIIFPENRIVVDYGERKELIYLATTDNKGNSFVMGNIPETMSKAKEYKFKFDYESIKKMDDLKNEGFVGVTPNGMRFKIKFDTYMEKHAIVTNTTTYDIWKAMQNKNIDDLISIIPDEFYGFVKTTIDSIQENYDNIYNEIMDGYSKLNIDGLTKKEFAELIKDEKHKSFYFNIFDLGKINESEIWKRVKPEFRKPSAGA